MARYETIDTRPRFLAVDLLAWLLPGIFEHALNSLLDHEIDLSVSTRALRGRGVRARLDRLRLVRAARPPELELDQTKSSIALPE
ncbi:MAG: hypothetical protein WA210_04140 [Burkholderiaceae bacterium]